MANTKQLSTEEFLANEFVTLRLTHFKKLFVRVKLLILEIVEYYLSTFYPFDEEASQICKDIEEAKKNSNEKLFAECYKRFLEFLPVRLRSGIQGKNLFRQPTEADLRLANFYKNDLQEIKQFNKDLFEKDKSGINEQDRLLLLDFYINEALNNSLNEIKLDI